MKGKGTEKGRGRSRDRGCNGEEDVSGMSNHTFISSVWNLITDVGMWEWPCRGCADIDISWGRC